MRTPSSLRGVMSLGSLLVLTASLFIMTGCGGPERAPHQPITGVDRPADSRAPNPHDQPAEEAPTIPPSTGTPPEQPAPAPAPAPGPDRTGAAEAAPPGRPERAGLLGPFVGEIAGKLRENPGIVAVFPALTPNSTTRTMEVNGLGQRLAEEISDALQMQGFQPLSGDELINDILASNRGLDEFRSVADVFWLSERIGAAYAVFGTVRKKIYDRMNRDERLEIKLQCIQVGSRKTLTRVDKGLTGGPTANNLYRDFMQASDWKIGPAAPRFKASVDAEVKFVASSLVRKILANHGQTFSGKRMAIDPVVIRSVSGPLAGNLQAFTTSFLRALDKAESKASAEGATNPRLAALDHGPFTIHGKEYRTLGNALDVVESRRAALRTSRAGELSLDLSRVLAEGFSKAGGNAFEILPDSLNRASILNLIKREVRSAQGDGAVDPDTIGELKTKGAQLLVRGTFRPFMRCYQFRIMVLDVTTGKVVAHESLDFETRFKQDLDTLTTN